MQRIIDCAEEFKTGIARKIVLNVQEIYAKVVEDFEDNAEKEEIQRLNQLAMRYATNPLGQRMDKLVEVLRGNDGYLYHFHSFIAVFAPQELNHFYLLAKSAIMDVFTEQTIRDVNNNMDVAEGVRARRDVINGIHFLRYI